MKVTIEKVTKSAADQNEYVISKVMEKIQGLTRIEESFEEIQKFVRPLLFWDCGRGGNHIWVCNRAGERLMLITETRFNK